MTNSVSKQLDQDYIGQKRRVVEDQTPKNRGLIYQVNNLTTVPVDREVLYLLDYSMFRVLFHQGILY